MYRCPLETRGCEPLNLDHIETSVKRHIVERHPDDSVIFVSCHQDNLIWTEIPNLNEKQDDSPANRSRAQSAPPGKLSIKEIIVETKSHKEGESNATPSTPANRS